MSRVNPRDMALMPELYADLRRMITDEPPGVQAYVDREAAAVRRELAERGVTAVTKAVLEAYGVVLYQHGTEVIPHANDPTWSASWHGCRMAAVAQMWMTAP